MSYPASFLGGRVCLATSLWSVAGEHSIETEPLRRQDCYPASRGSRYYS